VVTEGQGVAAFLILVLVGLVMAWTSAQSTRDDDPGGR
jgi:hypothetical protein